MIQLGIKNTFSIFGPAHNSDDLFQRWRLILEDQMLRVAAVAFKDHANFIQINFGSFFEGNKHH